MAYPRLNATSMADAWSAGMGRSGSRWVAGINDPKADFNADPAKMAQNWSAGVTAAEARYQARVSGPAVAAKWKSRAASKVGSFTGAGTADKATFAASAAKLVAIIQGGIAQLPPKGPKGTNSARAQSFGEYMHAHKGEAKAAA